jgi:hypothetical protein
LVDLERRRVRDLLPDREADTLATWLQAHPSMEVVSRDRGATFAEGARRGAPQALQVADRFHVLKNLVEAFQQVVGDEHAALQAAPEAVTGAPLMPTTRPCTALQRQARETAQTRRQARYEAVRRWRAAGKTIREIATDLGMGQHTIQRLMRTERCPLPAQHPARSTLLSECAPSLRERWTAGEQNGQQLLRELRQHGYRGSQGTLDGLLARWSAPRGAQRASRHPFRRCRRRCPSPRGRSPGSSSSHPKSSPRWRPPT